MSSTSKKHKNFTGELMGEKPVTEVAGIGDVLGKRLADKGYDKAYLLLGQFLLLRKDKEIFAEWLKENINAGSKHANDCAGCLNDWCQMFM